MKRWLVMILGVVLIVVLIGGIKACSVKKTIDGYAAMGEPKSTVSTVKVAYDTWQPTLSAVGTLRAVRGVDLATEAAGRVDKVVFASGSDAKPGELLVQLVVDADVARLDALRADAELAKANGERAKAQLEAEAISRAQADATLAQVKSAQAAVAEQEALILRKSIRAPFAGRLGISAVNPGQYLNPGDKVVTLQQLDPIYVDFTLPQGSLSQVKAGMAVTATTDSFPGEKFTGEVSAINPIVDAETRNIRVQATLKNPQRKLLPGMFGNVTVTSGEPQRLLTLPQSAVAFNPYGETVFVVVRRGEETKPDPNKPAALTQAESLKAQDAQLKAEAEAAQGKKAEEQHAAAPAAASDGPPPLVARQVFIKTGASRGDQIAVTSGLQEGDEVVTSGQLKLKNGTLVVINNSVQPSNLPDPRPVDQ